MTGMDRTGRPTTDDAEHLIAPLVPTPVARPAPQPAPLPTLPAPRLPTAGPDELLLGMARLDRSGRLYARSLLAALGWPPGHRVEVTVVSGVLVVGSASSGLHVVGGRGELALPAAARQLCDIPLGPPVVLAASPPDDVLIVHPAGTVAQLLREHYAHLTATGQANHETQGANHDR